MKKQMLKRMFIVGSITLALAGSVIVLPTLADAAQRSGGGGHGGGHGGGGHGGGHGGGGHGGGRGGGHFRGHGGGGFGGGGGYYGGYCGPVQLTLGLCGPYGY